MHDDRSLVEARLKRVLDERIRPAVYPESVPLDVAVWHAPGEPVPVAEGLAAAPEPIAVGERWGAPWGTSWFRVTGTVPAAWAGPHGRGRARPRLRREHARLPVRGPRLPARRHPGEGPQPAQPVGAHRRAASRAARRCELLHRGRVQPGDPRLPPLPAHAAGRQGHRGQRTAVRLARMDLAVFDETVWELVLDLEVLGELMHELPVDGARRWDILRAVGRALDALDLQDVNGTAAAARARARRASSPPPPQPSAHRISAVGHAHIDSAWLWPLRETVRKVARTTSNMTALMDDDPDFVFAMSQAQQCAWIKEHRPEVYARVQEGGRRRPVRAGRRHVGRVRHQHARRARRWPASSCTASGSSSTSSASRPTRCGCPTPSATPPALPQIIKRRGLQVVPHAEDLLEPDQQVPAPHLPVGGHRRHPDLHPLPARRHLQLLELPGSEIAHAGAQLQGQGRRHGARWRPFGWGDGGGGTTREMLGQGARGCATSRARRRSSWETPARVLREGRGRVPERRRSGSASCTWNCTAAPSPARRRPSRATAAASTCCARPSCGRRPPPCATGFAVPVRGAGPHLEDGAAAPVPRHPARLVHRLGAPRGRADVRSASPRS